MNNRAGKIHVLSSSLSSRIAAGEVVERPAAAVKELIENSLDAGSSFIAVEIEEGGCRLIRVTDNGEGMTKDDALMACQRFATSKLASEQDLFRITTLGFRGEALPSMASVSKFRLLTVAPGHTVGTELTCTPHGSWQVREKPAAPGTQVELRDLFYNTPGRKKFLKTPATECSHIGRVLQQAALAWPSIHFRLRHNGHPIYEYPAVSSFPDRAIQIYGARFVEQCLFLDHHQDGLTVTGLTIDPRHARTSRSPQELFVNRRPVKNATIAHAIHEAYETFLPKGRHPAFILYLQIAPDAVDVNVHPAKREVRFSNLDLVHRAVKTAVRRTFHVQPSLDVPFAAHGEGSWPALPRGSDSPAGPAASFAAQATIPLALRANGDALEGGRTEETAVTVAEAPGTRYGADQTPETITPLGQIHCTYLVAELDGELQIVDQHTAHERVLFERLWRSWRQRAVQTQNLLIPEPIEVPPPHEALLDAHLDDLARVGVHIERFGPQTFVLRAIPALLGSIPCAPLVHGLVEDLTDWVALDVIEKKVRAVLATMACKSAVQAGRALARQEIVQLLTDWAKEGRPMTCPHGRRIALCLNKEELDRTFARA